MDWYVHMVISWFDTYTLVPKSWISDMIPQITDRCVFANDLALTSKGRQITWKGKWYKDIMLWPCSCPAPPYCWAPTLLLLLLLLCLCPTPALFPCCLRNTPTLFLFCSCPAPALLLLLPCSCLAPELVLPYSCPAPSLDQPFGSHHHHHQHFLILSARREPSFMV